MRYYKKCTDYGKLIAIGTGFDGVEITEEEYNDLHSMICEKATLVNALYYGEITLDDVPKEWQEEIQQRVDERIKQEGAANDRELSADEVLGIILGGEV